MIWQDGSPFQGNKFFHSNKAFNHNTGLPQRRVFYTKNVSLETSFIRGTVFKGIVQRKLTEVKNKLKR
jgi:hypothetical protein